MLVRKHRGGLDESMGTVQEVTTWQEFKDYWQDTLSSIDDFRVTLYCNDIRVGWTPTYLVTATSIYQKNGKEHKERGVLGMCNEPLPEDWHD